MLALLADIHANLLALEACLADARGRGAERFAFLGDLVGYGADSAAVVDLVSRYVADGAVIVKGNHDAAAAGARQPYMNAAARAGIRHARKSLSAAQREFLAGLPLCVRNDDGCFVHASAAAPERWDYVDGRDAARRSIHAAGTSRTWSGHVHEQQLYLLDDRDHAAAFTPRPGVPVPIGRQRRCVALVGSVGQPRDGNTAAAYALVEATSCSIVFVRVPYDNLEAARRVRDAGLPESLAWRLERGV